MGVFIADLKAESDWDALYAAITSRKGIPAINATIEHLKSLGATSALIEEEYLDRDFTAEFSAFYSKVFKRYSKDCRRIHFFADDISAITALPDPKDVADALTAYSKNGKYLGYAVVRPIEHAPLGHGVLAAPKCPENLRPEVLVRSVFETHVLGAALRVEGAPFTQQDARIGACAQASIWMAGRHFFSKHRGPWVSTVDVTEAATKPTDHALSSSLPAGSSGLTIDNMVRALRAMRREPLLYTMSGRDSNTQMPIWSTGLSPAAIIDRYIDSGIPVILGLTPWTTNTSIGHAVVATGHIIGQSPITAPLPPRATRAAFCEYFLVNDDQHGPNLRMPVRGQQPHSQTPYSLEHVGYLIIPLPDKVFTPAESAETISWDLLRAYAADWASFAVAHQSVLGNSVEAGDKFCDAFQRNDVVARTYLTYGWKYKKRMLQNICSGTFKNLIMQHELPRFVWVTEFGTIASLSTSVDDKARVLAHSVIDATSSPFWEGYCIFHAPGYASRWYHNPQNPFGPYVQAAVPIGEDAAYRMKVRGT